MTQDQGSGSLALAELNRRVPPPRVRATEAFFVDNPLPSA